MENIDPLIAPMSISDTNLQLENKQIENETLMPCLQSSQTYLDDCTMEYIEDVNQNHLQDSDMVQVENENSLDSECERKVLVEGKRKIILENLYSNIVGCLSFLIYKVIIPFGEYVLMNSTLWIILKSTIEVLLEMLLYVILAICYVFFKFISQMDSKPKVVPQKSGDAIS